MWAIVKSSFLLKATAVSPDALFGSRSGCRFLSSPSSDYCLDLVRRRDYEHFLASLLLPEAVRRSAFAIRAFNIEVSSIRDAVSDRTIGRMRMQFWRQALDDIFEFRKPPEQPVAIELHRAAGSHGLDRDLLLRMISCRESLLSDRPFDSLDDLDVYSHGAFSSVNFLLIDCVKDSSVTTGHNGVDHAKHAADALGKAEGAVTLLRGVPFHASKKRVPLPTDLMVANRLSSEAVLRNSSPESLRLVTEAVASRAQSHLDSCRFRMKYLTQQERLLMLPAVAVEGYLQLLHKAECDVFDKRLQRRNSWLPLTMYYFKWKKAY